MSHHFCNTTDQDGEKVRGNLAGNRWRLILLTGRWNYSIYPNPNPNSEGFGPNFMSKYMKYPNFDSTQPNPSCNTTPYPKVFRIVEKLLLRLKTSKICVLLLLCSAMRVLPVLVKDFHFYMSAVRSS